MAFLDIVNAERAKHKLPPLAPSLKSFVSKGWRHVYAELFGQSLVDCFGDHHIEAIEWHWESRIAFLEKRRPEYLAYFPIWSRGNLKSSLAERIVVIDAILSVAYRQPGYAVYISRNKDKVQEHIANIESLLASDAVRQVCPALSNPKRTEMTNQQRKWTSSFLKTEADYSIQGGTLDSGLAGSRVENTRPTFLCHKKGTQVFADNQWQLVEDHPTARTRITNGYEVKVWGNPESEVVTPEHRYWVREYISKDKCHFQEGETGWKEAKDLHKHCWIGLPIDMSMQDIPTIEVFTHASRQTNHLGQFISSDLPKTLNYKTYTPDEFNDPDWWWLFGLWWGDGHRTKTQVGITIANKDTQIFERVKALLCKYGKPFNIIPKYGCFQLLFNSTWMSRWLKTWKKGNSRKQPPEWVEHLPLDFQRQLIRGYIDADGWVNEQKNEVRLTSIHLDGLYCVRRILARLGVASSIRKGAAPRLETFRDGQYWSQQKYDLRFQTNASQFGWNIPDQQRYSYSRTFIADGFLWTKIRDISPVLEAEFIPITTQSGTYTTHFGLSHNCPDDIDGREDSPIIAENRARQFTREVLPMRQENTLVFFAQNLISRFSVMYKIHNNQLKALSNRKPGKPIPAVYDLVTEQRVIDGVVRDIYISGTPSWPAWTTQRIQDEIDTEGLESFKVECQHEVGLSKEGRILYNYTDEVHVISESEFISVYGSLDAWLSWRKKPTNDWARTKTDKHANVAMWWTVSSEDTPLPNHKFLMYPMSFPADSAPEDVAERLLSCLTPYAYDKVTWAQLRQDLARRANVDVHTKTVAEKIAYERQEIGRVMQRYATAVLQRCNVQQGEMSHEQDTVRKIYANVYGLSMKPTNPKKHGGTEAWNREMRIDWEMPNPFRTEQLGYSQWHLVVPDDKDQPYREHDGMTVYRPKEYPLSLSTKDMWDDDLCRFHLKNCRYRPPMLTATGEEIDVPEKIYDDFFNAGQMAYVGQPLTGTALSIEQQVQLLIPQEAKTAMAEATTPYGKFGAMLNLEFQEDIAKQTLGIDEEEEYLWA